MFGLLLMWFAMIRLMPPGTNARAMVYAYIVGSFFRETAHYRHFWLLMRAGTGDRGAEPEVESDERGRARMTDSEPAKTKAPGTTARHALGGMVWSGLGFGSQAVGHFLVVIVFARFLTKSDNGLVAAAIIVIALGQLFTEPGFGPPSSSARTSPTNTSGPRSPCRCSPVSCMTVVVFLAAPLAADFFHQPAIDPVMRGLCRSSSCSRARRRRRSRCCNATSTSSRSRIAETVSYFFGFAARRRGARDERRRRVVDRRSRSSRRPSCSAGILIGAGRTPRSLRPRQAGVAATSSSTPAG